MAWRTPQSSLRNTYPVALRDSFRRVFLARTTRKTVRILGNFVVQFLDDNSLRDVVEYFLGDTRANSKCLALVSDGYVGDTFLSSGGNSRRGAEPMGQTWDVVACDVSPSFLSVSILVVPANVEGINQIPKIVLI